MGDSALISFFFLYVVRNMQAEFLVEILRLSCCLEVGL